MKHISIQKTLYLVSAVLGITIAIQLIFGWMIMDNLNQEMDKLSEIENPVQIRIKEIQISVIQVQQWLTDISATRGQDGLDDGFEKAKENAEKFHRLLNEVTELDPHNAKAYKILGDAFEAYYFAGKVMAGAYVSGGPEEGNKKMADFDRASEA
ncbi:MAG: hypothetical protein OEZ34_16875, partial [Spirochaetia bacterium]|nr:hypothetical protein [Spirochaetia bacterium]